MDKIEYFEKSKKLRLTQRCPILNLCERRLATIFWLSHSQYAPENVDPFKYLKKKGEIEETLNFNQLIRIQGEYPSFAFNPDSIYFSNMCPEIHLFDSDHSLIGKEISCTSASYEKGEDFQLLDFGHFSECPEFCNWKETKSRRTINTKTRGLSKKVKFEIKQRDNFICQYCGKSKDDGVKLHIDHILPIAKGGTDHINNLTTACEECNLGKSDKII
jgi:hypothetical protein